MAHPYKPPLQFNAIHSAVYHRAVVSSPPQRKAPRNGGAEINGDMKKGPTEQGPEPQRLSRVPVWIATSQPSSPANESSTLKRSKAGKQSGNA
jgi:hypothetical protein